MEQVIFKNHLKSMQKEGISYQVIIDKNREAKALKCDPEKVDGLKWQVYLQQINQFRKKIH